MAHIADLRSAEPDPRALGGKGANLARMIQAGLPVPPAFVVTADAFREFLGTTELGAMFLGGGDSEDLLAALERTGWSRKDTFEKLQETLRDATVPDALASEIREAYAAQGRGRVAVRSSATDEDGRSASFAGQYETFLDVEGDDAVLEAVRKCWASLASFRSYVYRKREGLTASDLSIAVVVQRMVPAEVSGVLFTTTPVGSDPNHLLVESAWGLGEGIVGGLVVSDSFVLDKARMEVVSRVVRYKLKKYVGRSAADDGLEVVAPELREKSSLSDDRIVDLARLALCARDLFGGEQDVEWAVPPGGEILLLQARPITTSYTVPTTGPINPNPDETDPNVIANTMWSCMDGGEATVGLMTPLSEDFMCSYYRDYLHPLCLRATGMWYADDTKPAVGYVFGRGYLNVSHWAHSFGQAPPFRDPTPLLRRFCSEEVDFETYRTPYGPKVTGLKALWAGIYWLLMQWRVVFYRRSQRVSWKRRIETFEEYAKKDLAKLSMEELREEIARRERILVDASINYFPYYFMAFAAFEAVTDFSKRFLPGENLHQKLKADVSQLRTIDVTVDLWELARKAREVPAIETLLRETPPEDVKDALQASPEGRRFWEDVVWPVLVKHGVRGQPPEMEFMHPRWVDDPTLLFRMARQYLEKGFDVDEVLARGENERTKVTREALARISWPRRLALKMAIGAYYRFGETRETNRMWAMTETWVIQRLVREIARRMVEMGLLKSIDEMAFVPFKDFLAFAAGTKKPDDITRERVEANRQRHLMNLRVLDPPLTFVGPYDPSKRLVKDERQTLLTGLGTSPGQARGRARVVVDVTTQAEEFQPGEVLVAHFTNATWTPLFVTAAAVVVDIGSVLAHSSVVAREYGIPCVANTQVATRAIRTGDLVTVDGDAGRVVIEERADAGLETAATG